MGVCHCIGRAILLLGVLELVKAPLPPRSHVTSLEDAAHARSKGPQDTAVLLARSRPGDHRALTHEALDSGPHSSHSSGHGAHQTTLVHHTAANVSDLTIVDRNVREALLQIGCKEVGNVVTEAEIEAKKAAKSLLFAIIYSGQVCHGR